MTGADSDNENPYTPDQYAEARAEQKKRLEKIEKRLSEIAAQKDPVDLFISFVFWFATAGALCLAILFASWIFGYGPWSPERYKAEQDSNSRKLHYIQRIAEGYQEVPESAR